MRGTPLSGQFSTPPDPPTAQEPDAEGSRRSIDFFSELKRRKVYRVGAAYLAVAFAGLEGAQIVFDALGIGPGVFNGLVILSLVGFPVAIGLAWTFDVTDSGIERTAPLGAGIPAPAPDRWVRLKAALVGAGFVAVVWMGVRAWQPLAEPEYTGVPTEQPWLAVLPIADLSPDGDQAWLADGLQDEILHRLAQMRGINLTSRTSTLFFRGVPGEVAGDSLRVRYVLESSLRMAGEDIMLTIQLIDAESDEHLWSEVVPGRFTIDGIFELQQTLATKVAASLKGTLAGESDAPPADPPTRSLEAYNEYLRGVYYINLFTVDAWWQAVDRFEAAVKLDPRFGLAHAWMASTLAYLNNFGGVTQGELFPRMREHAELALRYGSEDDPRILLAQMAYLWPQDFNWAEARRTIERALEIDPNHVDALWYLAEYFGVIEGSTDRGLEFIEEARRLDPYSPRILTVRGWVLMNGGRYEDAIADMETLLSYDPGNLEMMRGLVSTYALSGRVEEARAMLDNVLARQRPPYGPTMAAHMARVGYTDRAREVLAGVVARKESGGSVPASGIAVAYAALGELDTALDWLERSFRDEGGVYYLRSYDFAPLAGEPRFQVLWDRVGLFGHHWALDRVAAAP